VKGDSRKAFAVWITGLPASGKSTIAASLRRQLEQKGAEAAVLESDVMRQLFQEQPVYDERDRDCFYAALAFIARVLTEHGVPVIVDATANRRSYRDRARLQIARFVEVFVDTPLAVCAKRDPKGIYRLAGEGKARHVPGVQTPYEAPVCPDLVIRGDQEDPGAAAGRIVDLLGSKGFL
jgi:adenylylsulfate kinase